MTSVYPSDEDDVITSPYNSILAMKELNEHADCVLPIDNQVRNDFVVYGHIAYRFIPVLYLHVFFETFFSVFPCKRKK